VVILDQDPYHGAGLSSTARESSSRAREKRGLPGSDRVGVRLQVGARGGFDLSLREARPTPIAPASC